MNRMWGLSICSMYRMHPMFVPASNTLSRHDDMVHLIAQSLTRTFQCAPTVVDKHQRHAALLYCLPKVLYNTIHPLAASSPLYTLWQRVKVPRALQEQSTGRLTPTECDLEPLGLRILLKDALTCTLPPELKHRMLCHIININRAARQTHCTMKKNRKVIHDSLA